jgi:hypothetical protein
METQERRIVISAFTTEIRPTVEFPMIVKTPLELISAVPLPHSI